MVIARLVHTRYVDPKKDDAMDYYLYTMQTDRILRGKIVPRFRIYEENSSGRAGFDWNVGETYLLFLSYMKGDRAWELDGCGNSGPLRKSAKALKEIDEIKTAANGGVIAGDVWFDPGVTVIVKGTGGTFRTQSDKEGQFRIQVPAGIYWVRPVERGARFVADALSYELPRHVHIQKGSCAQIRFNRAEPGEPKLPSDRPPGR